MTTVQMTAPHYGILFIVDLGSYRLPYIYLPMPTRKSGFRILTLAVLEVLCDNYLRKIR